MSADLVVVGTPLDEERPLSPSAHAVFTSACLFIGESRKIAMRHLAKTEGWREKPLFLLDQQRPEEKQEMEAALAALAKSGGTAALFSDCGLPILFDPGEEVLLLCRRLGFRIRSCGAETSWGTAAALSAFGTPFLVLGFPPRENEERRSWLANLKGERAHAVLMDTPYRFIALLAQCREILGPAREAFLAWEIGKDGERLLWGNFDQLASIAQTHEMKKGEFVLVVRGAPSAPTSRGKTNAHSR